MLNFLGRKSNNSYTKKVFILIFLIIWIFITVVTLLFGFTYNWPDNVHIDYGLPLT
jgi:hypothetical protein